jgi:hypothetical protein
LGTQLDILHGHSGSVYSVSFNHGGNLIASGSSDATIIVWDLASKHSAFAEEWARSWKGLSRREQEASIKDVLRDLEDSSIAGWLKARQQLIDLGDAAIPFILALSAPLRSGAVPTEQLEIHLRKLGSEQVEVRDRAQKELGLLGRRVLPWIRTQLEGKHLTVEARSRLIEVRRNLTRFSAEMDGLGRLRLVLLLRDMASSDAVRRALQEFAEAEVNSLSAHIATRALDEWPARIRDR